MAILYTIAVILLVLWLCGFFIHALAATLGFGIHALLVVAIILFVIGMINGRRASV